MIIDYKQSSIVNLSDISIPVPKVLKRLGYPVGLEEINSGVKKIFNEELQKAPALLEARGIYKILKVESRNQNVLKFSNTLFAIQSKQVVRMLRDSDPVILFMVTIGKNLEKEVSDLINRGEMVRGVILDAIGSETTDAAADKMHRDILKKLALDKDFVITPRFSPGYGDWPVTIQKELLEVCEGGRIGISVNDSFLMIPRKSVSAVLGWKNKT